MDLNILLRYLGGESTAKETVQIDRWLSDDPDGSHAALYKEAHAIYDALIMQDRPAERRQSGAVRWTRTVLAALSVAAMLAIAVISANFGKASAMRNIQSMSETVSVPAGRTLELTLEDGTKVWLNSETEISYPKMFGRKHRRLSILKGEVLMDVTKDAKRPFIVETASADVKVYGTRFDLVSDEEKGIFSVALFRGSIGVTPKIGTSKGEIRMHGGQSLTIDSDGSLTPGRADASDGSTDWTRGLVNIAGNDLREVIERLGKAFGTIIVVKRDALPEYNVSRGRVRIMDGIDHALDVVQLAADFKYNHDYNTDTIIIQ